MIRSRFWKTYIISAAAAVLLLAAALAVFYAFIDSYEKSQPEYAARMYAEALTDKKLAVLVDEALPAVTSPYESTDTVRTAFLAALTNLEGDTAVRKNFSAYTADAPAFFLCKGDTAVAEITLSAAEAGAFGMDRWDISAAAARLTDWTPPRTDYHLYAPKDAVIFVNGIPVDREARSETDIAYAYASKYEPESAAEWELYKISDLCAEPAIVCTLNGEECTVEEDGAARYFRYPTNSANSYTVTVPQGSSVTVNGVPLLETDAISNGIQYEYISVEANLENRPTALQYRIDGLFSVPQVAGTVEGVPLTFTQEGNGFTAAYPDTLKYTLTIRVPSGSSVTLHGKECSEFFEKTEPAFPEISSFVKNMPAYDVYTLRGLYLAPDDSVQVSLAGTELPVAAERTEFDVQCTAKFPPSENSSLSARAMDFAKAYITYTGQGFNNTDQHLADVLSYVIKNTDTYKRIENSKIAFIYVTPVLSSKYNRLEVTSVTQYNDTLCACTVEFDVQQNTYGHLRDYVGTFHLIFTEIDGCWMIADMQIFTK